MRRRRGLEGGLCTVRRAVERTVFSISFGSSSSLAGWKTCSLLSLALASSAQTKARAHSRSSALQRARDPPLDQALKDRARLFPCARRGEGSERQPRELFPLALGRLSESEVNESTHRDPNAARSRASPWLARTAVRRRLASKRGSGRGEGRGAARTRASRCQRSRASSQRA